MSEVRGLAHDPNGLFLTNSCSYGLRPCNAERAIGFENQHSHKLFASTVAHIEHEEGCVLSLHTIRENSGHEKSQGPWLPGPHTAVN